MEHGCHERRKLLYNFNVRQSERGDKVTKRVRNFFLFCNNSGLKASRVDPA